MKTVIVVLTILLSVSIAVNVDQGIDIENLNAQIDHKSPITWQGYGDPPHPSWIQQSGMSINGGPRFNSYILNLNHADCDTNWQLSGNYVTHTYKGIYTGGISFEIVKTKDSSFIRIVNP